MKTKFTIIIALITAVILFGCSTYQPIVDTKGVDMDKYFVDLRECQQYATQVDPAANAAAGAVAGAVIGAAIGAILGNRQTAGQGAAIYGLLGAGGGATEGAVSQRDIILRCMAGRGYKILH